MDGYIFTTANDTRSYSTRNPKNWTIYGCNDFDEENKSGGTWSVIQSVENDNTMRAENYTPYSFKINDNNRAYTYYKLVITANHGEELMQLSELEFLYAKTYKITFDKNGGDTDAVPNEMYSGLGLPTEPTKDGYLFVGWYTKDGTNGEWGEKITENTRLNNDTTVYARWRIYGSGKAVVFPENGFLDKRRTTIYLGKYPQTDLDCFEEPATGTENVDWIYKHMPGWSPEHWWYSLDPIKRQVHSTNGKMAYMISANMLDTMNYSDIDEAVTWDESKLCSFLNDYSGGFNSSGVDFRETNFKDRAFSETEYGVIAANPEDQKDSHLGGADIIDKIFVPSLDELNEDHGLYPSKYRTAEITDYAREGGGTFRIRWDHRAWMLRKNSNETGYYYASYTDGGIYYDNKPGNTEAGCVRLAFNLDYSKIAFATDVKVGKDFDGLTAVGLSDNNEYKLTALDGAKNMTAEYKSRNGNVIEFEYSNADSGNNEYLSAIIKNNGEVRYYGRLKNIADENGTYSLTLPSDYNYFTGDRLYVFNEQINGTYELDLASGLSEIDIMTEVPLITFDKNGGDTEVEPQSIYLGGGLPTTKPTKIGYKFVGYYTQDGTNGEWGTEFTAETQVEENITVYAKYEMLTVTFDTNGGDTETTSRIYSDGLPETDPTRLGYVFEGWYTMNGKNNNWGTKVT